MYISLDSLLLTPSTKRHPHEKEIDVHTRQLSQKYQFPYHQDFSSLTSLVYHYLTLSSVQLANDILFWMWVTDDYLDSPLCSFQEKKILIFDILNLIETKIPITHPIALYLGEVLPALEEKLGWLYPHWRECLKISVKSILEKLKILLQGSISLEDYLRLRPLESGFTLVYPLMFLDDPDNFQVFYEPYTWTANEIIWKINDLFSYSKDLKDGIPNYLNFLKGDIDKKKKEVIKEINKSARKLLECDYEIHKRLIIWCRGNITWHLESPRYCSKE